MKKEFESIAIADFLKLTYNWNTRSITRYAGEIQLNFKCINGSGEAYNVKLFPAETNEEYIEFLSSIHQYCSRMEVVNVSKVIDVDGVQIHSVAFQGKEYKAIVLEWVDGKLLSDLHYHPPHILRKWGAIAAEVQLHLADFSHNYAAKVNDWDPLQLLLHEEKIDKVLDDARRNIIAKIFSQFRKDRASIDILPKAINHNDLHTENILVAFSNNEISVIGLIDFGDANYTARINELAISCAYAMMGKKDILASAGNLIKGFTKIIELTEEEISHLELLIRARLSISVLASAVKRSQGVTERYQFISENSAWEVLEKLEGYPSEFIHFYFRSAAGFLAHPNEKDFDVWLYHNRNIFADVMSFNNRTASHIDLSVGSSVIPSTAELHNVSLFGRRIVDYLGDKKIDVAYGGYGELRPFYTTDNYEVENDEGYQWRTRHIGLDLWTSGEEYESRENAVYCPYDGEIVSSHNNDIVCDYGPTIIIKHSAGNIEFYTLYGHLSKGTLELSPTGKVVKKGDLIGFLGNADENGNWPPHLHFQVMLSLVGNTNNFPGVCYDWEWDIWSSVCPDPHLLIPGLPHDNPPSTDYEEIMERRKHVLGKNLSVSYKVPLVMLRGHMQFLYDHKGRRYLDTVNNVAHVGHEHPKLVNAATTQMQLLNTNTRYLHPILVEYAEKLLATLPKHLTRVYFTNSGSESNELALRMAQTKTSSTARLAYEMGYHGNTSSTVGVSSYKFDRKGGKGAPTDTTIIGFVKKTSKNPKQESATIIGEVLRSIKHSEPLTFIGESILSCAGQEELDAKFVQDLYIAIQSSGGVCIADEVQTGFGRVGETFWAFQLHDVKPDIVTMGKPMGNGHPIGAVACTEEMATLFDNGMEYFNTYGGNPVSMTIASAVLDIVKNDGLQQKASKLEQIFYQEGANLQLPLELRLECKGKGLFLGLEFHYAKKPATDCVSYIVGRMRNRGILLSSDGPHDNVLKLKPPMSFTEEDMKRVFENLQLVFNEYGELIR